MEGNVDLRGAALFRLAYSLSCQDSKRRNSFAPLMRLLASAVNGKWTLPKDIKSIPCPVKGDAFMKIPHTAPQDAQPFIDSLKSVPKSGMHNPLKNPERFAPTILHLQAATFSFPGQPSQ
jgi:hypothetical protein